MTEQREHDLTPQTPLETSEIRGVQQLNDESTNFTITALRTVLNLIAQSFIKLVTFDLGIKTDTIVEKTGAAGVNIDGVLLKDSGITTTNDIKLRGKELLQSKTILDQQINPYYHFDGDSGSLLVSANVSFTELFANGGAFICKFNVFSAGESDDGVFFNDSKFGLSLNNASGQLFIIQVFSGNNGIWTSDTNIVFNKDSIVTLCYNSSNVDNDPAITIDGIVINITRTSTPTGTATLAAGNDLNLGNVSADTATFDGNIYSAIFFNRELTVAEAKSFSSNPQKSIDFADIGGSNIDLTSGTVNIGKRYRTETYIATDDFTNVADIGASANVTGAEWIAIATTPTDWTNSSILHQIGATVVLDPRNSSQIQAKDSANGNHGLLSDPDILVTPLVSQEYTDIYKAVSDNDTFDVPVNTTELKLIFDVLTAEGGTTIRIGTSNGGEQVVADVATTSQGIITATIVLENFKAGDQLFIGSDGGGGWTTLDLTVHVFYKVLDIK